MIESAALLTEPGLYPDIVEERYHADPVIEPSLSASVAKLLVHRSARHAWHAHPRLNKAKALEVEKADKKKDIGTACHKIVLGKGRDIKIINYEDYKKKDAQIARDQALANGMVPILADDMREVEELAVAAKDQLADSDLAGYFEAPGQSELTMVWRDVGGIWCRGRIDRLPDKVREGGHVIMADLKTTSGSSHFDDWERVAYDMAYDTQCAFYPRGLRALIPSIATITFKFAVIEQKAPFGLSVIEFPGIAVSEAEEDVELAMKMWAVCRKTGKWPSYDGTTAYLDKAPWRSSRSEGRRMALQNMLARWQRPLELDDSKAA